MSVSITHALELLGSLAAKTEHAATADELGIPLDFNAAAYFVDRHIDEGRGERTAIECGDQRISYADVLENVNRVGSALRDRLGVRAEERVVLLLLDGPEFAYSFFGTIKIGAVAVPLNTRLKPDDYAYLLNDTRARVAIVSEALLPQLNAIPRERLRYVREIVVVGSARGGTRSFEELLRAGSPSLEAEPTTRDDAALWLYSSGSTGSPKGCIHLHHDMVVCASLYAQGVLGMRMEDRCLSAAKLFFAYGLGNALYFPFSVGATAILVPDPPQAATMYAAIERYRPTLFFSVPTNYGMLLAHEPEGGRDFDLSSIRWAVSAGEALPPAMYERFLQRFGVQILDGIGSTEALQTFISNRPGDVRPGSSGKPVPGYAVALLDEHHRPVAPGEVGELYVSGDSTCAGYWNKHDRTKAVLHGAWLRTGDRYRVDEDGYFWYAGRSDDMLKVGGIWVSPIEVENVLMEHTAVSEVAVVGCADQDELVKPLAYVVLRSGQMGTPELAQELQAYVRERLAEYKRPRWIEFVPELPKTATGKIQRFRLREGARVRG